MPVGVVLPGSGNEIQTELVIPQSDLTWLEADSNQHGPKIAFVVIHFVIVDLYFRTESEPECGQLEESLSTPRRDIYQQQLRGSEQTPRRLDDKLPFGHVFQHRDENDDVQGLAFEFWQRFFDCPLMEREFLKRPQVRRSGNLVRRLVSISISRRLAGGRYKPQPRSNTSRSFRLRRCRRIAR
jgi:hypothetical protein